MACAPATLPSATRTPLSRSHPSLGLRLAPLASGSTRLRSRDTASATRCPPARALPTPRNSKDMTSRDGVMRNTARRATALRVAPSSRAAARVAPRSDGRDGYLRGGYLLAAAPSVLPWPLAPLFRMQTLSLLLHRDIEHHFLRVPLLREWRRPAVRRLPLLTQPLAATVPAAAVAAADADAEPAPAGVPRRLVGSRQVPPWLQLLRGKHAPRTPVAASYRLL